MPDLDRLERTIWNLLLLLVPVSASPLLPFGAGTLVRPLALLPALALLGLALLRFLVLGQRPTAPRDAGWLLWLFAIYVTVTGLFEIILLPDDSFKGQTPPDSFLRALVTLALGLLFYAVARLHLRSAGDIRNAIFWLLTGLSASIALAVLQVIAIVSGGTLLHRMQVITNLFAVWHGGLENRAQGMTLEPSWLATQITLLMLPALVARIISRQKSSGEPVDRRNIIIALGGFAIALTGLLCAGSRFGLASAVLILLLAGAMALWQGRMAVALSFIALLLASGGGVLALGSLSAGAGTNYVLGPFAYLTDGPQPAALNDPDIATTVTDALSVAGRAAAAQAAFELWLDHPLFGISLGNTYRYFGRYAPDWSFATGLFTVGKMEGTEWMDPSSPEKANAKNFLLRLLAETGLVGFLLFTLFCIRQIFGSPPCDRFSSYFRLASAAALVFSFFNQDSFADPAVWIVLVMCQAMGSQVTQKPEATGVALA